MVKTILFHSTCTIIQTLLAEISRLLLTLSTIGISSSLTNSTLSAMFSSHWVPRFPFVASLISFPVSFLSFCRSEGNRKWHLQDTSDWYRYIYFSLLPAWPAVATLSWLYRPSFSPVDVTYERWVLHRWFSVFCRILDLRKFAPNFSNINFFPGNFTIERW